jgi:hypothetical protein
VALKNRVEGRNVWANLVEVSVNANSTAYFTSHPDTLTYIGNTYRPIPCVISEEEMDAQGTLPKMTIDVSNFGGEAYRFAKDNDLTGRSVTLRTIHTTESGSGDEAKIKMSILSAMFANEVARFDLFLPITLEAEGPVRTYNRRDFPGLPYNMRQFGFF